MARSLLAALLFFSQIPRQYDVPLLDNPSLRAHIATLNTVEHYRSIADSPQLFYCLGSFTIAHDDGTQESCERDGLVFVESGWIDFRSSGEPRPELLIVEIKQSPGSDPLVSRNAARTAPAAYRLRLENQYVRVFGFHLGPGERSALHQLSGRDLVYPLTSATLRSIRGGTAIDASLRAGVPRWTAAPTQHQLENAGATEAVALLVELK